MPNWVSDPSVLVATSTAVCVSSFFFLLPHIFKLRKDLNTPIGPIFSDRSKYRVIFLGASIVVYNLLNFLICTFAIVNLSIIKDRLHTEESVCETYLRSAYAFYFFTVGLMWHTFCSKLRVMDVYNSKELSISIMVIAAWASQTILLALLFIPETFSTQIMDGECTAVIHLGLIISFTAIHVIFSISFLTMFTMPLFRTRGSNNVPRYRRTAWINIILLAIALGSSCALCAFMVYMFVEFKGQKISLSRFGAQVDMFINIVCLNLSFNPSIYKRFYGSIFAYACLKPIARSNPVSCHEDETNTKALARVIMQMKEESRIRPSQTNIKDMLPMKCRTTTTDTKNVSSLNKPSNHSREHSTLDSAILSMLRKPVDTVFTS